MRYNPNTSFEDNFKLALTYKHIHAQSTDFSNKVEAREMLDVLDRRIARARSHPDFDVNLATLAATEAKRLPAFA